MAVFVVIVVLFSEQSFKCILELILKIWMFVRAQPQSYSTTGNLKRHSAKEVFAASFIFRFCTSVFLRFSCHQNFICPLLVGPRCSSFLPGTFFSPSYYPCFSRFAPCCLGYCHDPPIVLPSSTVLFNFFPLFPFAFYRKNSSPATMHTSTTALVRSSTCTCPTGDTKTLKKKKNATQSRYLYISVSTFPDC